MKIQVQKYYFGTVALSNIAMIKLKTNYQVWFSLIWIIQLVFISNMLSQYYFNLKPNCIFGVLVCVYCLFIISSNSLYYNILIIRILYAFVLLLIRIKSHRQFEYFRYENSNHIILLYYSLNRLKFSLNNLNCNQTFRKLCDEVSL